MSASALIVAHLNAPVGPVLTESDVVNSLKNGYLSAQTEKANAVLSGLFVEVEPRLIVRCALEAESTVGLANLLYLDTLAREAPKCPLWESSIEFLL